MAKKKTETNSAESAIDAEIKIFIPNETEVTTVHGDKIRVPKITWKKEIQLIKLIEDVLGSLNDLIDGDDAADPGLAHMIQRVLSVAPEKATRFVSVVLEKEDDWVEDNLDLPEIVSIIIPLLRERLDTVGAKISPYITQTASGVAAVQSLEAAVKKMN